MPSRSPATARRNFFISIAAALLLIAPDVVFAQAGGVDPNFDPNVDGSEVKVIAVQPDGKILIGGTFVEVGGQAHKNIARLNADGTLDSSILASGTDGVVYCIALQPDGKILLGGSFANVYGTARKNIARLNANGTLESTATFNPGTGVTGGGDSIRSIAVQSDGKIVIGGGFTNVGGAPRNNIARLKTDGSFDTGLTGGTDATVLCVAVQPDGKILLGGQFNLVESRPRHGIARLNENGTIESTTTFNVGAGVFDAVGSMAVQTLAVQTNGKIVLGGSFTGVNGLARSNIARLNSDGTVESAATFNAAVAGGIDSLAVQPDGKILIAGSITTVNAIPRKNIARLNVDGSVESIATFNPGSGADRKVSSLALQADGKILLGGTFYLVNEIPRNLIARLGNASSAPAEIAVEQTPGADLLDGTASVDFGNVLTGANSSRTFTIKNIGGAALTGLGIAFDGPDAATFSVIASPAAPVPGPNGSTTFTVRFAPALAGTKTAAMHVASNDADEGSFDVTFTGRALAPLADNDGDGLSNAAELNVAALGFDPLVDNTALLMLLRTNGLYQASDLQTLALGNPVLAKDPLTGHFHLSIGVLKSPDLAAFTPLLGFSPTYNAQTGKIDIEITPDGSAAQFYRVLGTKP